MMKRRVKLAVNNPLFDMLLNQFLLKPITKELSSDDRQSVLEVGCGQGSTTEALLNLMPNAFVTATDIDDELIRLAEHRIKRKRVEFMVEHAAELSFDDETFDLVAAFNTLLHVPAWRKAVAEAARVLRPGGRYAVTGVSREGLKFGPFRKFVAPKSLIDPKELTKEAKKRGFRLERNFSGPRYTRLILQKVRGKGSNKMVDYRPVIR
ncbi:MAG: methyltransferase domain-containing protein [Patescibacteria group bacterium]|nr:methyltransferase domain-containing protein [Patescibacteria group bacterium]